MLTFIRKVLQPFDQLVVVSLFLQRLIVKEFLDEIDVGEKHSSAAVAAQI